MATMNLTRVLSRISVLKKMIGKSIEQMTVVAVTRGQGERRRMAALSSGSIEDVTQRITSSFQSAVDLIAERARLREALLDANSKVIVVINRRPMTIAAAVEYKNSLEFDKMLIATVKRQLVNAEQIVEKENDRLQDSIDNLLISTFQTTDKSKIKPELYEAIAAPQREEKEAALLDPLNIRVRLDEMEKNVGDFLAEVDFALSEVNARTGIEV